ncbi:hypothetical protein MM221_15145 [Salipaludibacillus sp. LMS25]|uniref:YiiX/YebB-like N1pC/P60 family cysteine hydrolase n=1 Tax=Salipaludibacillus sp. LMS25 TaxID=2924031 RepID=UPI0020D0552A|nr:YiiX/YebB-like N1pC/P60 family cysteine hydrolase [Salipaludibacillus sp. LMS25]UTR13934.1 hypothetical protein MM221_15145 [Salipaludibacillus sp. LMS25]
MPTNVFAGESEETLSFYLEELVRYQPGVTLEEVKQAVTETAEALEESELEVAKESLTELLANIKEDQTDSGDLFTPMSGSSGKKKLDPAVRKGDIFYTPSATLNIQHGHVGIYYTTERIVESVPKEGVRKIKFNKRDVEKNAVMQRVKTTKKKRNAAANWANSRIGDSYSYNFATNRETSKKGAKNCSKLVWSAYKLKAGIDIDKNGGKGVYPKDIRDSSHTVTYKTIK